jgi:hypothetical protein
MVKVIDASFHVSSSIANHSTILGDAREHFISEVLKKFLPANVIIGSGQIIDVNNNKSKQIDIIVYRNDFPVLRTFGTSDIYLVEGVLATIEVKSQLNENTLFEALENGKSVKSLRPSFVMETINYYSNEVYSNIFEELTDSQKNSIMGMVLPSTYIYSYKGYTEKSLDDFKNSLDKWHYNLKKYGELDPTLLPEIITTEGCVAQKNLNNFLELQKVTESEFRPLLDKLCEERGNKISYAEACFMVGDTEQKGFDYSLGIKTDSAPLQYLISNLLENIFLRLGHQQLGKTPIQYNLLHYHMTSEMNYGWKGAAINFLKVGDPRLDFMEAYNKTFRL